MHHDDDVARQIAVLQTCRPGPRSTGAAPGPPTSTSTVLAGDVHEDHLELGGRRPSHAATARLRCLGPGPALSPATWSAGDGEGDSTRRP
ncbi:MAG: hypothetical protein U5R31_02050 [Acidimicrobiia bacterium]|nr:hypothetical protein [Acidimicrobiia bacterium]